MRRLSYIAVFIALFVQWLVLPLPTANAYASFDEDAPYRYQEANGNPYGEIVDSSGNVFTTSVGNWRCVNNDGNIIPNGGGIESKDINGDGQSEFVCPGDVYASLMFNHVDGNDTSSILVLGSVAQASGLTADQGSRVASFIATSPAGTADLIEERLALITLNNGHPDARAGSYSHIEYVRDYQYVNDSFTSIQDSLGRTFDLYDGDECPFEIPTQNRVEIISSDSDRCEDGRYYRYQSGEHTAFILLPASFNGPDGDNVPLDQGARLAQFMSFDSSGRMFDYIALFGLNEEVFAEDNNDLEAKCIQEIGVLSWILCPILNFTIDKVIEPIQGVVIDLLQTDSLLTAPTTDNNSVNIYNAWVQFKSIANALLAVAFIFLIYLMLFSENNAYSIQRMLPRLVVITLLIQVSYFIAAAMVDVGNVTADGIANIFESVRQNATNELLGGYGSGGFGTNTAIPSSAEYLSSNPVSRGVGAGVGIIIAIAGLYLWTFFVPGVILFFAFGLMLSILGVFLALALRQLAIVVLIVLAPLAFLLGLLPATEKWMKEWFDNLGKLILIYPLFALVFGAGSLLSYLAISTNQSEVNMMIATALGMIVLFAIPVLLTFAGRIFKGFTGSIMNFTARSKSAAQGDVNNPLSWKNNINYNKAQRQYMDYERIGSAIPISRRFLRPSWKAAHLFNTGAQRMQGVVSPTHPANLRRLYWGGSPFKSLAGYANWRDSEIKSSDPFKHEIKNITKSTPMLYSTVDQALKDTGFLFDRALNYSWGIHRMYKDGEIDRGSAELMWGAFQSQIKGQGHRLFFGAADPSLLLDHDYANPADLGHKWFADNLNQISDPRLRRDVAKFRQSSYEDFGNAGTERETGASWRYGARWNNDDSFLDSVIQRGDQRYINAVETQYRKAQTMNMALNDPRMRAEMIARMEATQTDDSGARVGGYGQSGQAIRHMEEWVQAATYAYNYMQARGVNFTDEINDFNY